MIFAGLLLLAVGAADLVRQFAPRRWIGYLAAGVPLLVLGILGDAALPAVVALALGATWVWAMPDGRRGPASFWPAVILAAVSAVAVVLFGARPVAGLIGSAWSVGSPFGPVAFDLAVLAVGVVVFLLESGNVVVRAALDGERSWRPAEGSGAPEGAPDPASGPAGEAASSASGAPATEGFKGGRLIGPLERVVVFLLTLTAAYPLLAAMLAAKGIVRFPEISRDGETGARAEYFLVGTLVSWVTALGGALLVGWAAAA